MSYSNGIISAPVTIDDVKAALGESSNDLATLCKSEKINMWSKYKPVSYATNTIITKNQLSNCKYGLSPTKNDLLLKCTYGYTDATNNFLKTSFEAISNNNKSWEYIKPIGGANSPFRLSDFLNSDNVKNNGYNNDAVPPLSGFSTWNIKASELCTIYSESLSTPVGSDGASNLYNHTIVNSSNNPYVGSVYSSFNFKFGESSWQTVGNFGSDVIPINYILGSNINNEYWRLAIAMKVPNRNVVDIIVSNYSLYEYNKKYENNGSGNASLLMPSFASNQLLAYNLERYVYNNVTSINNPYINIKAFFCLVKNAFFAGSTRMYGSGNIWFYPKFDTNGVTYCTPLYNSFDIKILANNKYSNTQLESYNLFEFRCVSTGTYVNLGNGESYNNYPINHIMLFRNNAIGTYNIEYTLNYSYLQKTSSGITPIQRTISAIAKMESGNISKIIVSGMPSLSIINVSYKCTKV